MEFEYPDDAMATWEALWGEDFISPGGADEVRYIIRNFDLKGKSILEVGCGRGGPSLLFGKECGAAKVLGVDLQAKEIEKASRRAAELGIDKIVEFKHVDSLHWPVPDESVDVVFSKDAILHTADKEMIYSEMKRVLKPGGHVIYADWFGSDLEPSLELQKWLSEQGFPIVLNTLGFATDIFVRLGFTGIHVEDRCHRFREQFEKDMETLRGELGQKLAANFGPERLQDLENKWFEPCVVLSGQGQLRVGSFYATKPAC